MKKCLVLISFAVIFLLGIFVYDDFGISVDEHVERDSSYLLYSKLITNTDIEAPYFDKEEANEYWNRYYMAIQLPTVVLEQAIGKDWSIQQVYFMRHLYTFLLYFTSVIVFYFLCKSITNSLGWSLIGVWMLVLTPRILGEAFYNIKDIPALATGIFALYAGSIFLKKPRVKEMLVFAFMGALFTNTRIVGAVLIIACIAVLFIEAVYSGNLKRGIVLSIGSGLASLFFYILMSPNIWNDIIGNLINTVTMFTSYEHDPVVYYMGKNLSAKQLPWHYLFVWIFMSVPLMYTVFFGAGIAVRGYCWLKVLRKKDVISENDIHRLFPFLTILIPILYFIIKRPVIYNGWRHFYFIYPIIVLYAVQGVNSVYEKVANLKTARIIPLAVLGISFISTVFWIVKNHPNEFLYFNPLMRQYAFPNFEKDYWSVTERELLQWICDHSNKDGKIKVANAGMSSSGELLLSDNDRARLVLEPDFQNADYIYYIYSGSYRNGRFPYEGMYDEVYNINVDGFTVGCVLKRNYDIIERTELAVVSGENKFEYTSMNGNQWNYSRVDDVKEIIGRYTAGIVCDLISIDVKYADIIKDLRLFISEDSEEWYQLNDIDGFMILDEQLFIRSTDLKFKYIKILYESEVENYLTININVCRQKS